MFLIGKIANYPAHLLEKEREYNEIVEKCKENNEPIPVPKFWCESCPKLDLESKLFEF